MTPSAETTDHAASSHGVPVLVLDGQAHGPADRVDDGSPAGCTAADLARKVRLVPDPDAPLGQANAEDVRRRFLEALPAG